MTMPELTPAQAVEQGILRPGLIVLSNRRKDWIASAIRAFEALHLGRPAHWQHAMRVAENPEQVISQNLHVEIEPLLDFAGCMIRVWEPPGGYGEAQIKRLLEESELALGRTYDWLGIAGQVARVLPWVGDWLSEKLQFSSRTFCSEFVCIVERKARPGFMAEYDRYQVSPADINDWCMKNGWLSSTFRVVA